MMHIDDPAVSRVVFHPRKEGWGYAPRGIRTETQCRDAMIGGYLHVCKSGDALMLFFHGNGEIAADYDVLADLYTDCGVSFWVVDYRGYGRSTGMPSFSQMFTDADMIFKDIPRAGDIAGKRFDKVLVMGRSLGSASAIYLSSTRPEGLHGLLLDSPFADGLGLIHRMGGPNLGITDVPGFVDNLELMKRCTLPTLIIYGTEDRIIPISDAKALYESCKSKTKRLVEIRGAGHNDILLRGFETYRSEIRDYIFRITASGSPG
jgi:pimeloyl-ACP methyl ester carboxylesterase